MEIRKHIAAQLLVHRNGEIIVSILPGFSTRRVETKPGRLEESQVVQNIDLLKSTQKFTNIVFHTEHNLHTSFRLFNNFRFTLFY